MVLEKMFGDYSDEIMDVIHFIIGKPNKAMAFAYILTMINMMALSFKAKSLKWMECVEKLFAYTAFIIIGNIIDTLGVNAMLEWEGRTQIIICLYIVIREITMIKQYLTSRFGIDIPILNQRLNQVNQYINNNPNTLNDRINTLRQELKHLEMQKQDAPKEEEKS